MTTQPVDVWNVGTHLFGEDIAAELAARIADPATRDALEARTGAVTRTALDAVRGQLAGAAAGFVNMDLSAVLLQGWAAHRELHAAAVRTLAGYPAAPEEKVRLAKHEIGLTQHPTIDVTVDGRPVLTLHFELALAVTVYVLVAVVRVGYLVAIESGSCEVKATFSVQGAELAAMKHDLDPAMAVPLGTGAWLGVPRPRAPR
jgi:hypothetical protein